KVKLRGLYRGQPIEVQTGVSIQRVPDTVVYQHPVGVDCGVAVRAHKDIHERFGRGKGALTIVLDISGSMLEGAPKPLKKYDKSTPCKYHEATRALREMLKTLPKDTYLSVLIFSQAVGKRDKNGLPNRGLQPFDAKDTLEWIRPPRRWDPAQLNSLMDELEE